MADSGIFDSLSQTIFVSISTLRQAVFRPAWASFVLASSALVSRVTLWFLAASSGAAFSFEFVLQVVGWLRRRWFDRLRDCLQNLDKFLCAFEFFERIRFVHELKQAQFGGSLEGFGV